jgi:hypothetical protein
VTGEGQGVGRTISRVRNMAKVQERIRSECSLGFQEDIKVVGDNGVSGKEQSSAFMGTVFNRSKDFLGAAILAEVLGSPGLE